MGSFNNQLPTINSIFQEARLFEPVHQAIQKEGFVILTGKGGTGKSQVALEYCHKYRDINPGTSIIWIPSGSKERFKQSLREVARDLSLLDRTNLSTNIVKHFREGVSSDASSDDPSRVLFVFDDIGQDVFLKSCTLKSSTIIVQRLGGETLEALISNSVKSGKALVEVNALQLDEAKKMLLIHCRGEDENAARYVVEKLEMSALALTLAISHIREIKITITDYMQKLKEIKPNYPADSDVPKPIWLALRLSISQIKKEKQRAFEMLSLISMIDRQSVNEGFIFSESEQARNFYGAIRLLKAMSLLPSGRYRETYFIHRYTQLFMLEELKETRLLEDKRRISVNGYPRSILIVLEYSIRDQNEVLLRKQVAKYYKLQGQYDMSFELYDCAHLKIKAADALDCSSKYSEAESILENALKNTEELLRINHPILITITSNLASIYVKQAKYHEAVKLYNKALEVDTKVHGKNHATSWTLKTNLACALVELEQYTEAEELHNEAIQGRTWLYGEKHPDTIKSMSHLAVLFYRRGRYADAVKKNNEILEVAKKVLGTDHPDTLDIMNNISINLLQLGEYSEAESMQRPLLDAMVKQLGVGHEAVITSRLNLATTLEKLGKYEEAEREIKTGLESIEKIFPDHALHPMTLKLLTILGLLLLRQGKFTEAEPILRDELAVTEANFQKNGGSHLNVLISENNFAGVLLKLQKYEESEKLFRKTLDGAKKLLGEENPITLRITNSLSQVLRECAVKLETEEQKLSALHEAESLQTQALQGRMKVCGMEHPDTYTSRYQLGLVLQDLERYKEAVEQYEKALAGFEVKLGTEHETTIACREHLNICLTQIERLDVQLA